MINWLHLEDGFCEGVFESVFFRDDEGDNELTVGAQYPSLIKCAEKCVDDFNKLSEKEIENICKGIINSVKENGQDEEIDLSELETNLDILKYCWFTTLYANMSSLKDKISYIVEGEGEWGDLIGFVICEGKVIYVGSDYFDYMKNN